MKYINVNIFYSEIMNTFVLVLVLVFYIHNHWMTFSVDDEIKWKFFTFFHFIVAMTSQPTNESELQLYRVLQRANLLSYYDTFICQGKHLDFS